MARLRLLAAIAALLVVLTAACARQPAVQGQQVSGCPDAIAARASASAAIDLAAEQAIARNGARAEQLRAIAVASKRDLTATADLGPCDDPSGRRGVAVDIADLRARYRVIVDRTTQQLNEAAAQPAPILNNDRNKGKGKGTKGD
jgi:predicted aminopeptidase